MGIVTVNELAKLCKTEIAKGNGDKKILISDDDEGNGYHGLFYHFTPSKDCGISFWDIPDSKDKEIDHYIVLG